MEIMDVHDLNDFDEIYKKHFSAQFPRPTNANIPAARTVTDGDILMASGFVKLFIEAIIATEQDASINDRVKAIKLLLNDLIAWCKEKRVEQIHIFPSDEKFAEILKTHFGFEDCKVKPLVLNLEI